MTQHHPRRIRDGAVDIWQLAIDRRAADDSVLDVAEHRRAIRFRDPAVRKRFVARRAAMRSILATYVGCPARALRYAYDGLGKPSIEGSDLAFSVSSSGDFALLAVGYGVTLGVDVEALRPLPDVDDLIRTFVPANERDAFLAHEGAARERSFLRWWTETEASLKAAGCGLAGIDAPFVGARAAVVCSIDPDERHVASLALDVLPREVTFRLDDAA